MEERKGRVSYVIGPDGSPLTLADLPPPSTRRWVIRRKAEVVAAVRGGLLSLDDACKRYTLTVEEFLAWQHAIDRFGLAYKAELAAFLDCCRSGAPFPISHADGLRAQEVISAGMSAAITREQASAVGAHS